MRCEDYPGALTTYGRALQLAPRDAALWHERGLCQCRQKNWQEAITSLRDAIALILEDRREDGLRGVPADAEREVVVVE